MYFSVISSHQAVSSGLHCLIFSSVSAPGLDEWSPEEISWRNEDNTASRYCSWGSVVKVLYLEHHLGVVRHWDSLVVSKSKNLVIIKYCVKVLNPDSIDWTIADNPIDLLVGFSVTLFPDLREDSWNPFTLHNTIKLWSSNGFWIHSLEVMGTTKRISILFKKSKRIS